MLKLIYQTAVFGVIDFEYERPVIRVGRDEDNDLVLRHPSVEPHHCLLVFRGEKVLCLPPSEAIPAPTDLGMTGIELGPGDLLPIGELQFGLAHSSKSVAIPEVHSQDSMAWGAGQEARGRYYCGRCQTFIREADVRHVGLVGHVKRNLCPRCSRPLEESVSLQESDVKRET